MGFFSDWWADIWADLVATATYAMYGLGCCFLILLVWFILEVPWRQVFDFLPWID